MVLSGQQYCGQTMLSKQIVLWPSNAVLLLGYLALPYRFMGFWPTFPDMELYGTLEYVLLKKLPLIYAQCSSTYRVRYVSGTFFSLN